MSHDPFPGRAYLRLGRHGFVDDRATAQKALGRGFRVQGFGLLGYRVYRVYRAYGVSRDRAVESSRFRIQSFGFGPKP